MKGKTFHKKETFPACHYCSRVSRPGRSQSDHIMAPYKSYNFPNYDRPGIIYGPEYDPPGIIYGPEYHQHGIILFKTRVDVTYNPNKCFQILRTASLID